MQVHFFAFSLTRRPCVCNTLYLSDHAPADIRLRRTLNTSCYVLRRMHARAHPVSTRIGLEGRDYPFTADAKRGWRILNKPFPRGNENAEETACPDCLNFGVDRLECNEYTGYFMGCVRMTERRIPVSYPFFLKIEIAT